MDDRVDDVVALVGRDADPAAIAVLHAIGCFRPAVIGAWLDEVQRIAAVRAMLVLPQAVVAGILDQALGVAVTVAVDLGKGVIAIDEGVVFRYRAVVVQSQQFAVVDVQILRPVLICTIAEGAASRMRSTV